MNRIKITVIKCFTPEEVFGDPYYHSNGEKMKKCHLFESGQQFIVNDLEHMPKKFCGWAWKDIARDLPVLYFNGNFYGSTTRYVSCSDGRKPVVFKLEPLIPKDALEPDREKRKDE